MASLSGLIELDEEMMVASSGVKALYYIEPINEKDQKQQFLSGRKQNPHFFYKDLEYDPQKVAQRLEAIEIPNHELGVIFEKRRKDILLENRIILHRGIKRLSGKLQLPSMAFPINNL